LGFNQEKFPEWGPTFKKHLEVAKSLHDIKEIIVMDHDCCGAYKMIYGPMTPEEEKAKHVENVINFEKTLKGLYPDLSVHALFMRIDGSVEKLN